MPKEKRCPLSKYWCFTWNNYPSDHLDHLSKLDSRIKWIFGYEVGESGTPHLQGYLEAEHRIRPIECLGLPEGVHYEKRKGNQAQAIRYCCKDGKVKSRGLTGIMPVRVAEPTGWQCEVVAMVDAEPDERTIIWIWEESGRRGKTQLARYLCHTRGAIYLNGAKRHVLATAFAAPGCPIFIFGVPRTTDDMKGAAVSYSALEQLKDGLFHSGFGTDATGMCLRNPPHIIVLANERPDTSRLSLDRWKVGYLKLGEQVIEWDT